MQSPADFPMCRFRYIAVSVIVLLGLYSPRVFGQAAAAAPTTTPAEHPALFLVGDSIMKTGTGNGERGPWGWGSEIAPFLDAKKIHVYNEGRGGRSSRGYIQEGLWAQILSQLQAGDFVIVQFGHNDAANSANYPDRITLPGNGEDTRELESPITHEKQSIHSYGWYLRQYAKDAKAKGATLIICSPTPRNTWIDGKIKRGFDGYAQWAADAAKESGAVYIDLNRIAADRYDAIGQQQSAKYFADNQHTTKLGARLNAESVVAGIRTLQNSALNSALLPATEPAAPTSSPAR